MARTKTKIPVTLHKTYNNLGHSKMLLTGQYPSGGWRKHTPFSKLMEQEHTHWESWTERTPAPCEIVLDYDRLYCCYCHKIIEEPTCPRCSRIHDYLEYRKGIRDFAMMQIRKLKKNGYSYRAWFTGSKGYHVHLLFPRLALYPFFERGRKKQEFIKRFHGELNKYSERVMITREGAVHRKTGARKQLVDEVPGTNSIHRL